MRKSLSRRFAATDKLSRWLVAIALAAIVPFVAVMVFRDAQRSQLWLEVGKGLIQIFVIGVLGTSFKLLADDHQARRQHAEDAREARRQRAEARAEFRSDKYRRVVAATSKLRSVPIYIRASPSVKTWNEQMPIVLAADAELRLVKHEIFSSSNLPEEPPFPKDTPIVAQLEAMYGYTTWVANDFAEYMKRVGEQHNLSEERQLSREATPRSRPRSRRRRESRQGGDRHGGISAVPSLEDMIRSADHAEPSSWVLYLEAHEEALRLIIELSLGSEGTLNDHQTRPDSRRRAT